jgi:hypothetical protein
MAGGLIDFCNFWEFGMETPGTLILGIIKKARKEVTKIEGTRAKLNVRPVRLSETNVNYMKLLETILSKTYSLLEIFNRKLEIRKLGILKD